jgi:hypothetical protein
MAKRTADDVSELRDAMSQAHGRGVRSPLYQWMRARHDELLDVLARPRWGTVAEFFAARGIKDGGGNPPTPETARATWYRVRQDVDTARRRKEGKPARVLTPDEIAPGVRAVTPQPERAKTRVELRPAMPNSEGVAGKMPGGVGAQGGPMQTGSRDASHSADADERIKAVLDELGGRAGRLGSAMPKQVK